MTMKRTAATLAVVAGLFASPLWAQKRVEEIVARVNGQIILKSELEKELAQLLDEIKQDGATGAQITELFEKMSKDTLRNLIDVSLLTQIAKEQDVDCQGPVAKRLDEIRIKQKLKSMDELEQAIKEQGVSLEEVKESMCRQFLTQEVINREVAGRMVITNQEMKTFYEEHRGDFTREKGIELGEIGILLRNGTAAEQRKKIEDIHQKLKEGGDFGDLAARFSDTPSAQKGGDVGYIFEKDMPDLAPDLSAALSKLKKGEISDILVRPEGFIILKVLDKHEGGALSFELAQNEIYQQIIAKRLPGKVRDYLDKQRLDGYVDVKQGYVDTGAVKKPEVTPVKNNKKN
jgi:parvulin-like peptidyl-prolyl isomerase